MSSRLYGILNALINRCRVYVVDAGSNGNWTYKKYSNGSFEAWYSSTGTMSITTPVGQVYQSASNSHINFTISNVASVHYADVKLITGSYGVWTYLTGASADGLDYRGVSPLSRSSATYTIKAYVKGSYNMT